MKHLSGPDDPKMMWSVAKMFCLVILSIAAAVFLGFYVSFYVI